uniref:Uncharacterized protein n=1 Tax=Zea mays TaxID=4577 RepID=A0A804LX64_MAIZE
MARLPDAILATPTPASRPSSPTPSPSASAAAPHPLPLYKVILISSRLHQVSSKRVVAVHPL